MIVWSFSLIKAIVSPSPKYSSLLSMILNKAIQAEGESSGIASSLVLALFIYSWCSSLITSKMILEVDAWRLRSSLDLRSLTRLLVIYKIKDWRYMILKEWDYTHEYNY